MYTDDTNIAESARNWINTLTVGNLWNVRLIQQKYRVNSTTGERKALPTRIRRYAEGCPPTCMKAAMDYLLEQAPYTGIVFRGEKLEGVYRPTKTEWTYDAGDAVNPAAGKNDATFTLVQDLVEESESDTLESGSSVNCTEEVTAEWHWDESSVEDLPTPEQGVTWAIQSLGRSEDGTFSYALIKRKAITSHMEAVTAKSTETETVTRETWKNLYGEPWNFTDDTGASVQVAQSSYDATSGTTTETQLQKNDDCTYDAVTTVTTAKPTAVKESSTHTQYEGQHSQSKLGQTSPLGLAPDASGGVIRKYEDQLQPDGRYSTQQDITVERPVQESKVTIAITRKGKRTTRVDTNQSAPAAAPTQIGETTSFEKTPGYLYNNTTSKFDRTVQVKTGETCEEDLYQHDHSLTTAGGDDVPTGSNHVDENQAGKGGHILTKSIETDEEGAVTVTNRDKLEREVQKSKETWRVTRTAVEHQYTDTQMKTGVSQPAWSKSSIGTAVSSEKTPGGLFNNTYTETTVPEDLDSDLGVDCTKTIFEHTDRTSSVNSDQSLSHETQTAGIKSDAYGTHGTYYEHAEQLNDDSSKSVTETEHREIEKTDAQVSVKRTAKAIITTTVLKNSSEAKTASTPTALGTISHSFNPGGTTDYTTVNAVKAPGTLGDRFACEKTVIEHRDETQTVDIGKTPDTTDVANAGGGKYYSKTSTVDDNGVVTDTLTTVNELKREKYRVEYRKTPRYTIISETTKNTSDPAALPTTNGCTESHTTNPGGTYDVTKVSYQFADWAPDRIDVVDTLDTHVLEHQTEVDQKPIDDPESDVGTVTIQWKGVGSQNGYCRIVEAIDDSTGIRTVTKTDTTEKRVEDFKVVKQRDHFKSIVEHTTRHDTETPDENPLAEVPQNGDGVLTQETYSANNGGSVDKTVTETTPIADSWYEPLVDGGASRTYRLVFHFRNFKYDDYVSEFNDINKKFDALVTTWSNNGTAPSSVDVTPSSNLNDYGLYDGTITVTAKWASGTASPSESSNYIFTDKTFTTVTVEQDTTGTNGSTATRAAITSTNWRLIIGRGMNYWDQFCAKYKTHLSGSTFNYSYEGPFSIKAVTSVKKATVKTITGSPYAWQEGDTVP